MGKSASIENPFGTRRQRGGRDLAPKSLRAKGRVFLSECTRLEKAQAGIFKLTARKDRRNGDRRVENVDESPDLRVSQRRTGETERRK